MEEKTATSEQPSTPSERLGVPDALFIDNIEEHMEGKVADKVLEQLHEGYNKYKFVEMRTRQRLARIIKKIPEIKQSLDTVEYLIRTRDESEELLTTFEMADTLHVTAAVEKNGTVCLWLGAGCMVEYTYDDARDLLRKNLDTATHTRDQFEEELDFVKDQITTTEVTIARVFNWDVAKRRAAKAAAEAGEEEEKPAEEGASTPAT
eukprot:gnl/Trimastix_PCT/1186.p1 GENE.gnl/Trimastix_PCT/1186~~gnl/Trimastix_PCT/1186.p1  ORF type:complete len:214 (+),score=71.01 gnl/Trimastix_PCT/1186:26-643(+)